MNVDVGVSKFNETGNLEHVIKPAGYAGWCGSLIAWTKIARGTVQSDEMTGMAGIGRRPNFKRTIAINKKSYQYQQQSRRWGFSAILVLRTDLYRLGMRDRRMMTICH